MIYAQGRFQAYASTITTHSQGNGTQIIHGNAYLVTSVDGEQWEVRPMDTLGTHFQYQEGRYLLASARYNELFVSEDGVSWRSITVNTRRTVFDIAGGNGQWLIAGGLNATSQDGLEWSLLGSNIPFLNDLTFGAGIWFATDGHRRLVYSEDGSEWTLDATEASPEDVRAIAVGDDRVVVARNLPYLLSGQLKLKLPPHPGVVPMDVRMHDGELELDLERAPGQGKVLIESASSPKGPWMLQRRLGDGETQTHFRIGRDSSTQFFRAWTDAPDPRP